MLSPVSLWSGIIMIIIIIIIIIIRYIFLACL